jgi:replicative DNA helicase
VAGASNVRRYAEIVAGKALLRGVIAAADNVATAAFQTADPGKVLDEAQAVFTELGRTRKVREPVLVGSLAAARLDRYSDLDAGNIPPGLSTGKPMLDELLGGGLRAGLYVVAARPSVGKSSWSADVGMHIAEHSGKPVLFISQEMPRESVFDRCVARTGGVPLMKLKRGGLSQAEWGRVAEATDRLHRMPFHIDDEPAQRLVGIRRKARAIPGLGALVVDYLQLCGSDIKTDNRNLQIEQLTRGLKALSTELAIPILALSQLNRSVEARAVKRPNLGDLRDSGAIEQDADVVIFLWPARENYDDKQAGSKLVGLAVDKNRDGALGEMSEEFRGWCQQWHESDHKPSQQTPREAAGGFQ